MARNTLAEISSVVAKAQFTTGDTVTIALYRNNDSAATAIDTAVCTEIASSGIFKWGFSNVTTPPTVYSDYFWVMNNGSANITGYQTFGGWPDDVASLSGANSVTITVQTATPVAIEGVRVAIYNAANTLLLDSKDTDSNGQAVFALDDASYKVRLQKSQVTFAVPEDLVVSGTTTDAYTGTPLSISTQAGANECEVSMFVSSQRPTIALSKLEGTAQITSLPTLISDVYYSGQKIDGTYDATNKRIYWILPQGSVIEFVIKDILGTTKASKSIQASSSANFQDLEDR